MKRPSATSIEVDALRGALAEARLEYGRLVDTLTIEHEDVSGEVVDASLHADVARLCVEVIRAYSPTPAADAVKTAAFLIGRSGTKTGASALYRTAREHVFTPWEASDEDIAALIDKGLRAAEKVAIGCPSLDACAAVARALDIDWFPQMRTAYTKRLDGCGDS